MSQQKITLRPPPHVDFVDGYPGIPAGHDRPHAEVKGTIEVRVGPQPVKAKWVRVELKKIETLPGGGHTNTFYDYVGQSPMRIWEADAEWGYLRNQDFPFSIRIPESVPPSINLDRGAGIKYELNATLCLKGKKNLFFKKIDPIFTTCHPIVIDKHELHSTWPVYAQPESRHVVEDLLILNVDRTHTCYGPGDKVKVLATFKNGGIPAAALRSFEFLLKETIIFRAGPNVAGKKGAPQVHVAPIGEQKVPINKAVYQGQQHRVELCCFIPQTHTTTTVNAARHIDIAYGINVRVVLGTGKPLMMEFPVTVSNWPRNMSIEAVRRIGPSPNLSLNVPSPASHKPTPSTISITHTASQLQGLSGQPAYYITPDHGYPAQQTSTINAFTKPTEVAAGDPTMRKNYSEFGLPPARRISQPRQTAEVSNETIRPATQSSGRRLTLVNAEMDVEVDGDYVAPPSTSLTSSAIPRSNNSSSVTSQSNSRVTAWPTAEEEKQRLFDAAQRQAQRTQEWIGSDMSSKHPDASTSTTTAVAPPASKKSTPWPTAEEEKLRLFNEAQKVARQTQSQGFTSASSQVSDIVGDSSTAGYSNEQHISAASLSGYTSDYSPRTAQQERPPTFKSAGAQLYQHAVATMNKQASAPSTTIAQPAPKAVVIPTGGSPDVARNRYPTAEEEKAALRYYQAKRAVDRHQMQYEQAPSGSSFPTDQPIAYDALYPSANTPQQSGSSPHAVNMVTRSAMNTDNYNENDPPTVPSNSSPPPFSSVPSSSSFNPALSEKERMRLRYEEVDAASATDSHVPQAPLSVSGPSVTQRSPPEYVGQRSRLQPLPPISLATQRPLTAAEEKALLYAQYESEEANVAGASRTASMKTTAQHPSPPPSKQMGGSLSRSVPHFGSPEFEMINDAPSTPPPLAPRPPAEYIQETREEDARTRIEDHTYSGRQGGLTDRPSVNGLGSRTELGLPAQSFSPFDLGSGFGTAEDNNEQSVAPPLPPKVPV